MTDAAVPPTDACAVIDRMLVRARSRLRRVDALEAKASLDQGALLVDIRPLESRAACGEIPGAIVIDRNTLEWRVDPTSAHRIPEATAHDRQVILVCNEGYASSLAAAALQDLGLRNATDLIGGFHAWQAAGLPVVRPAS